MHWSTVRVYAFGLFLNVAWKKLTTFLYIFFMQFSGALDGLDL